MSAPHAVGPRGGFLFNVTPCDRPPSSVVFMGTQGRPSPQKRLYPFHSAANMWETPDAFLQVTEKEPVLRRHREMAWRNLKCVLLRGRGPSGKPHAVDSNHSGTF